MKPQRIRMRMASELDVSRCLVEVGKYANSIGFDEPLRFQITTAVSELARNILKYAGTGDITFGRIEKDSRIGIEVIAQDRGPGIEDVERALTDHFSSGGTLGLGLPGVKRMMDDLEVDSGPGRGTRVVIRKWI